MNRHQKRTVKKDIQWIIRDKYAGDEKAITRHDYGRVHKKEPVDYIIGWSPFLDAKIDLSLRPLIPRPETEYWVRLAFEDIAAAQESRGAIFVALDIFAGSGCIGIALLKHFPRACIDFADSDPLMIKQIKINLKKNGVLDRARVIRSNGFRAVKKRYDFIFANPPYVSEKAMGKLPQSVKKYEPHGALLGGKDGLYFIKKFLHEAGNFLKVGDVFYMEFSPIQKRDIEKLLKKEYWQEIDFLKDQYGRWRVLRGRK